MNLLNIKLNNLSNLKIFSLYLFFLLIIFIPSIYYLNLYLSKHPLLINAENEIVLKYLLFDYGDLLNNLYYKNEYVQKIQNFDHDFYLARMPFFPFFLLFLSKISLNFYFIFFVKNLVIFSIIFFCLFFFLKFNKKSIYHFLILLLIFLYNPYNFHVLLSLDFVDTFVSVFFPIILLLTFNNNNKHTIIFSIFIFILYLSKSSLWLFCILFPLIFFIVKLIINKNKSKVVYTLPICSVLIAIFIWGFFGLKKANYFPFGASISSTNTYFFNVVTNKSFNDYYPNITVDLLINRKYDTKKFNNEKEFYDYFKKENLNFLNNNFEYYLKGVLKKTKFIFFGIYKDGNKEASIEKIRYSNFPNKILMNFALVLSIVSLIKSLKKKKINEIDLIYLSMFICYLAPYLIAWATTKHLVPLFLLSKIYLFLKIFNPKKIN
tara:strand:+ start:7044 stop:8345 length:1302 start_codon:yes stop_codon:yes gene_type:complete